MTSGICRIWLAALFSLSAYGQDVKFDVADAHVSPRSDWVKDSKHLMQGGFSPANVTTSAVPQWST